MHTTSCFELSILKMCELGKPFWIVFMSYCAIMLLASVYYGRGAMAFLFENLEVYKKALGFAQDIQECCKEIKRGNSVVVDQLQRASLSIATNIAEGNGRWHKKDRAHFFMIAKGSVFECVPLLEVCRKMELIEVDQIDDFRNELDSIGKMLTMLVKGIENRTSS